MREDDRTPKPIIGEDGKPIHANGHDHAQDAINVYQKYIEFQARALAFSDELAAAGFNSIFIIDQTPIASPEILNAGQLQHDLITSWNTRDISMICAEIAVQTAKRILQDTGNVLIKAAESQAHAKAANEASKAATRPGESVNQDG
jgi:hypothetical protein